MSKTVQRVIEGLREIAPEGLAESWDRVGLQAGRLGWPVRRGMLCIDLTQAVLEEAAAKGVSLVVAYHPLVFSPMTAVTELDSKQALVLGAVERRIAVYSPHTALDAVEGGLNDWLCDGLGEGKRRAIKPAVGARDEGGYKIVVFVPLKPMEVADRLRKAMATAGAGVIGDYRECSFGLVGEGTFRGGQTTNPTVGQRGRFERVTELRMEMVCPAGKLGDVVAALRREHPYEEPAFDVYRLEAVPDKGGESKTSEGRSFRGQGRILTLDQVVTLTEVVKRVKSRLGVKSMTVVEAGAGRKRVREVGVCVGAGGSLLNEAGKVDVFITGEMRHHDQLAASEWGVAVVLAGHTETERPYLREYRRLILQTAGGEGVEWLISRADRSPMKRV